MSKFNMIITVSEREKVMEMIVWALKDDGWFVSSRDGYSYLIEMPEKLDDIHSAKKVQQFNFIEGLILIVAPAIGMNSLTIDVNDSDSLLKTIVERYEQYHNSEMGERRT